MSQAPLDPTPPGGPPGLTQSDFPSRGGKSRRYAFYAVVIGAQVGVFSEWLIAAPLVVGFPNAQYSGFHRFQDAYAVYMAAMAGQTHPPPEHPQSLVSHLQPGAAMENPEDHPAPPASPSPSHDAPHGAGASVHDPPAVPAVVPSPASVPVAPSPVAPSHASPVAPSFASPVARRRPLAPASSAADIEQLEAAMHSLNVRDMMEFLDGRRVPGTDAQSEEPAAVLTVSVASNPNPRPGEDRYRVLVRTNLSEEADVLPCPSDDEGDENDARGAFSTAPSSPALSDRAATPSPPGGSNASVISISTSPSLSSVTMSSVAPAAPSEGIATLDQVLPQLDTSLAACQRRCPCTNCRRRQQFDQAVQECATPSVLPAAPVSGPSNILPRFPLVRHTPVLPPAPVREDGDEWYAVVRGHVHGVFRGPLLQVRAFIVNFDGAFFRGFQTRAAALAWFIEHDSD
ncbi:hypothetical protein FA95DRAFT_1577719 [Auriscalpium vulgare]|uniref:Uncharacterized protein n=1 Tax=Auriscalpium vulgare TaxID=40419 RepID=A0ACB8R5V5_9AGAM|nr:hypothetical protein FA95DRAFT_1577719 [Auriscalpium vulgare]